MLELVQPLRPDDPPVSRRCAQALELAVGSGLARVVRSGCAIPQSLALCGVPEERNGQWQVTRPTITTR
jgi:hypothetical protein